MSITSELFLFGSGEVLLLEAATKSDVVFESERR